MPEKEMAPGGTPEATEHAGQASTDSSTLNAAISYAARGWSVVPMKVEGEKKPWMAAWKDSQKKALSEADLRGLWRERPGANVGIVTGKVSGLFVVDFDGPCAPGLLKGMGVELPPTMTVKSPHGWHYYFKYDARLKTDSGFITAGDECSHERDGKPKKCAIDIRNDGAVAMAPPSVFNGNEYKLAREADIAPWTDPPELFFKSPGRSTASAPLAEGERIPEGQREATIMRRLGALRRVGSGEPELMAIAEAANGQCDPPLKDSDLERMVRSVMSYPPSDSFEPAPDAEPEAPEWEPGEHVTPEEITIAYESEPWPLRFASYGATRSDAPPEFHEAVGYAVLSVAIGRNAKLSLTTGELYCNLWLMLCADSTRKRKTTALSYGDDILKRAGLDVLTPDDSSPQRFVNYMSERSGQPNLFRRDEFTGFYSQANRTEFQLGIKQLLIGLYDGRDYERQLQGKSMKLDENGKREPEKAVVRDPFLSIIAGTQEEAFLDLATHEDVTLGFLPRWSFIVPATQPKRMDIAELDPATIREADRLADELREIAGRGERTMVIAPGVLKRWNEYQAAIEAEIDSAPLPSIAGPMFSRAATVALKIALMLAAADGERVELSHLYTGMEQAERWRVDSYRFVSKIGPTKAEKTFMAVADTIRRKGTTDRSTVMQAHRMHAREMDDLERSLEERGVMSVERIGKRRVYVARQSNKVTKSPETQPDPQRSNKVSKSEPEDGSPISNFDNFATLSSASSREDIDTNNNNKNNNHTSRGRVLSKVSKSAKLPAEEAPEDIWKTPNGHVPDEPVDMAAKTWDEEVLDW